MEENKYLNYKRGFQIINVLDEKNRYVEFKAYIVDNKVGQMDSHGVSYKWIRRMYQEMGEVMGFDKISLEGRI